MYLTLTAGRKYVKKGHMPKNKQLPVKNSYRNYTWTPSKQFSREANTKEYQ